MRRCTRYVAVLGACAIITITLLTPHMAAEPVVAAQSERPSPPAQGPTLEIVPLRPNFYLIAGAGANIGVQTGPDGVVVVDAGSAMAADAVVAAIRQLTPAPIRYIINTSADADHVGGNGTLSRAGKTLFTLFNPEAVGLPVSMPEFASILAAEQVLTRLTSGPTVAPRGDWPTETFDQARKYFFLNGEAIEVLHQENAHTDGDSIVFFRRSDVVVAGDVIDTAHFPRLDRARGGSVQGEIDALNRLVELAVPSGPLVSQDGGTWVIPGHGWVLEQQDVVEYRDMITILRDRIQNLMDQGLSLSAVKAANPTQGYTRRYGASMGAWTTDMFVEAVFTSLARGTAP